MGRLREPLRALRAVFANPNLRRVQLALAGSIVGQYSFSIALAVYAFRHGGAGAVGVLVLVRTLPAAVVSPFAAVIGDRTRRERVMLVSDLARAAAVGGAAAVVLAGGAWQLVYVVAGFTGVVGTIFRPAEAALLPTLARSPEELAAGNVSSSAIESVGAFVGPAIGGLVVAASTGAAFLLTVATFLWSAALVARLRPERAPAEPRADAASPSLGAEVLAGFRTIVGEPKLRVVVGLYAAQTVVAGGLTVLVVVVSLRLLDLGNVGVGYLNSALGVGGLVGGVVTLALVGRRRLAGDFGVGIVLWGVPLLVIGLHPNAALSLVMLGLLGVGNTLVDVSAVTLLQRSAADEVLARVFGVVEGLTVGAMAVGAILAPVLVSSLGTRTALVVTGAFLPAVALLAWPRLVTIDREARVPSRQLELLRGIPMFAPLPPTTLEGLAHALRPLHVAAGADVVRAGEVGDDYFVIDEGRAEVAVGSEPKPLGPGDAFGEIALLRDVPRTATVRAVTDLRLYALAREPFLEAVTGHVPSLRAADLLVAERLGSMRARGIEPPRSVSSTGT